MKIDETEFRRVCDTALAAGDITNAELLECVSSYLVTGVAEAIAHFCADEDDWTVLEESIDDVLFCLENCIEHEWAVSSYEYLLTKYTA